MQINRLSFCLNFKEDMTEEQMQDNFKKIQEVFKNDVSIQSIRQQESKNGKTYMQINLKNKLENIEEFNKFVDIIDTSLNIPFLKIFYSEGMFSKKQNIRPNNIYCSEILQKTNKTSKSFFIDDDE